MRRSARRSPRIVRSRKSHRNGSAPTVWTRNFGFPTAWSATIGDNVVAVTMIAGEPLVRPASYVASLNGASIGVFAQADKAKDAAERSAIPTVHVARQVTPIEPAIPVNETPSSRELAIVPDAPKDAIVKEASTPVGAVLEARPEDSRSRAVATAERKWSHYQTAIFDEIRNGVGHLVIEAVAGAGKTTVLIEALKHIDPSLSVLVVAFNTSIQKELDARIPANLTNVTVATLSAHGYSILRRYWHARYAAGKKHKSSGILDYLRDKAVMRAAVPEQIGGDKLRDVLEGIEKLCSLCECYVALSDDEIRAVQVDHDLLLPESGDPREWEYIGGTQAKPQRFTHANVLRWVHAAQRARLTEPPANAKYARSIARPQDLAAYDEITENGRLPFISFRDMTFVVAATPDMEPERRYDVIFVDETQDMDKAQLALVFRSLAPGGRVVVVGDSKQAVYRFRGADSDAIKRLIKQLNATVLPLSVSYRVPACSATEARKLVPQFEVPEGTPEGTCARIDSRQMVQMWGRGDIVITRVNMALVPMALIAISQGITPWILGEGSSIAKELKEIMYKIRARTRDSDDMGVFIEALQNWHERERATRSAEVRERLTELQRRSGKEFRNISQMIDEDHDVVMVDLIYNAFWNPDRTGLTQLPGIDTPSEVERRLKEIAPTEGDVKAMSPQEYKAHLAGRLVLTSVHRIKGGEANRVFILNETFKYGIDGWQKRRPKNPKDVQEELNLWYVSVTRPLNLRGDPSRGIPPKPGELYYVFGLREIVGNARELRTEQSK